MATLSKEEYLKRYLSSDTTKKKKRKKTAPAVKQTNVRIIDDDVDLKSLNPSTEAAAPESDDEAPTVAEFIDERPEHVRRLEEYRLAGKWKTLGKDKDENDISSKEYGVISSGSKASSNQIQCHHESDPDPTPPRRKRHDSDSDPSPPGRKRHDSDSDHSPPKKQHGDMNSSTVPQNSSHLVHGKSNSSSGRIPDDKRTQKHEGTASGRKRHDSDSDQSLHRKQRHDSDSDQSPARKQERHDSDSDRSPHRKQRHSDSDQSPPRKRRHDGDSDQSPPRKQNSVNSDVRAKKQRRDSDQSPPRKRKGENDSDQSPPRRKRKGSNSDQSPPRRKVNSNGKPETKPNKTLSGAKAGLSSAAEMKQEAEKLKKREEDMFSKIERDALGKDARTVFRDKSGKRRDLAAEKKEEEEEAKKKAEMDKKYKEWGQGLKQKEIQEQNVQDYLHEMSKPLARYKDDDDLDRVMREMDREGDPMAKFIKKKTTQKDNSGNDRPRYKGPAPPPNRFGIMPGYRWDGVDRSNGFEKKIFAKMAEKKAVKEHAYKWSTEDM